MSIFDRLRSWLLAPLFDGTAFDRLQRMEKQRDYREGRHERFLKVRSGQTDDNLVANFAGLVIDRSVTLLFGKGVKFDLPGEDDTPEDKYIKAVLEANKFPILMHKTSVLGGEQGTCFLKIIPEGAIGEIDGESVTLPRLVAQDPAFVTIETNPEDIDDVTGYTIQYVIVDSTGRERGRKQEIRVDKGIDFDEVGQQFIVADQFWTIEDFMSDDTGRWVQVGETQVWEHDFPPMLHWQNLPDPTSVYGYPDVTADVIELQDRINFVASNISKIVRLYAHPQRYGRNLGNVNKIDLGPDDIPNYNNPDAKIEQLDPAGDLSAASNFLLFLRQSMFDITQTVDLSSMADKLGALTNFGLRVLYQDALAKLGTKRELYGDALLELVRRLLIIGEYPNTDPGKLIWPDVLPVDTKEQSETIKADRELGIVSKQTMATTRGYDWTVEQERMEEEKTTENTDENNIGAMILRNFNRGLGAQ